MRRRRLGTVLVGTVASVVGWLGCGEETCLCDGNGAGPGGSASVSGAAGEGGGGMGGSAGGTSGVGGGGAGGADVCDGDAACAAAGSLCVTKRCTEPAATCATGTLVVVPDPAFVGDLDAEFAKACHYRALGPALTVAAQGSGTTRVVVYASAVEGPVDVPAGVRLEGRATAPATLVALTARGASGAGGGAGASGAAGAGGGNTTPALVTLGAGAALAGFALDGKGAVGGVRVEAGAVRLEGPLTVADATRAFDLAGTADATVAGTQAAPVLLKGNRLGIVVGPTTKLALTGDGEKGGVTVEGTTAGAGVLVLAGDLTGAIVLEGLWAKDNKGSSADGTGAVEVRQGRAVTIKNSVFEGNSRGLTLNGESTSDFTSFTNVVLEGNRFTLATPGQSSALCGSQLGSETQLKLGSGNVFPTAMMTCPPTQVSNCNTGADVGHDTANAFAIVCTGG
jgi:hypothetical protein